MRKTVAICPGAVPTAGGSNGTATPASAAGRRLPDPALSEGGLPSSIAIECSIEGHVEYSSPISAKARSIQVVFEACAACEGVPGISGAEIVFAGEGSLSCTDGYAKGFGTIDWGVSTSFVEGVSSRSARADGSVGIAFKGTVKSGLFAGANVSASLTVSAASVEQCKAGEAMASADLTGSIKVVSD